jgi:hypothetical protein
MGLFAAVVTLILGAYMLRSAFAKTLRYGFTSRYLLGLTLFRDSFGPFSGVSLLGLVATSRSGFSGNCDENEPKRRF